MDEERLPSGFAPVWWSWLPDGTTVLSHAETGGRRLPDHGARHCGEGAVETEARPRPPRTGARRGLSEVDGRVRTPEQAAEAIIERARELAHFEARGIRDRAAAEAEAARVAILEAARREAREETERRRAEAIAEAERAKDTMVGELREQVFYEAARLREEATAEAEEIITAGRDAAAAVVDEARSERDRLRQHSISEAERVKAAIIGHARDQAVVETARLRAEALQAADEARAAVMEQATRDAETVRAEAERAKVAVLADAEDEAVRIHLEAAASAGVRPAEDGELKLLQASEVSAREFPQARRGFDRESVRKWLTVIGTSYATLEDELHRARREWERALELLEAIGGYLSSGADEQGRALHAALGQQLEQARATWGRSMETLSASSLHRSDYDLPSLLVRASELEGRLDKRPFGYSAPQVQRLLDGLTTEVARLENQAGALRVENEQLRARLLAQLWQRTPERGTIDGAVVPERVLAVRSHNGADACEQAGRPESDGRSA